MSFDLDELAHAISFESTNIAELTQRINDYFAQLRDETTAPSITILAGPQIVALGPDALTATLIVRVTERQKSVYEDHDIKVI